MSFLEPADLPKPKMSSALIVGASSPLWAYFQGAAMSGVAYWWMTRWSQPANLEAIFGALLPPMSAAEPEDAVIDEAVFATAVLEVEPEAEPQPAPVEPPSIAAVVAMPVSDEPPPAPKPRRVPPPTPSAD